VSNLENSLDPPPPPHEEANNTTAIDNIAKYFFISNYFFNALSKALFLPFQFRKVILFSNHNEVFNPKQSKSPTPPACDWDYCDNRIIFKLSIAFGGFLCHILRTKKYFAQNIWLKSCIFVQNIFTLQPI